MGGFWVARSSQTDDSVHRCDRLPADQRGRIGLEGQGRPPGPEGCKRLAVSQSVEGFMSLGLEVGSNRTGRRDVTGDVAGNTIIGVHRFDMADVRIVGDGTPGVGDLIDRQVATVADDVEVGMPEVGISVQLEMEKPHAAVDAISP